MKYESASDKFPLLYCVIGTHGAVKNPLAETESRSMIVRYWSTNHPVLLFSRGNCAVCRDYVESNLRNFWTVSSG